MTTSFERRDELFRLLLPFSLCGLVTAAAIGFAAAGHSQTQPVPPPQPRTIVYDCINIQHAPPSTAFADDHPARYAIARLARACEQQEAAIALMQIWETNPAAGEVAQP